MKSHLGKAFISPKFLFLFLLPLPVMLQEDSCTPATIAAMPFRVLHKDVCPLVENILLETYEFQKQCAQKCLQDAFCAGINFNEKQHKKPNCQLTHKLDHDFYACNKDDKGWNFYHPVKPRKVPCNKIKNCKNGGKLKDGPGSDPYRCQCPKEYKGDLCEDFDTDYNFALLKPTAQSSTRDQRQVGILSSNYAVDGIKADSCTSNGVRSCAHLDTPEEQWWRVDLQVEIPVGRVVITNRKDYEIYNSLLDIEINIGNNLGNKGRDNPNCGDRHSVPHAETKVISCSPSLTGRYVVIQGFHSHPLVLIEVEVFAAGLDVE